ncbi:hypothetical protein NM208_g3784 [Fusarium decemcellulare]|uniref:Uncharacterized protein n=1 Tax=Fusarium decemcellulare TaxID=57161 RepID=A0ACC1SND5_9HYPO|nr:hypothetical protein NM208_g3784 [Fusarium decemcellulare]
MVGLDDARRRQSARRPKPQVSCTLCRTKKNCRKRPAGSCTYVPKTHVRRLQRPEAQSGGHHNPSIPVIIDSTNLTTSNDQSLDPYSSAKGRHDYHFSLDPNPVLDNHDSETRLIGTTSWEAVLRDIGSIKPHTNGEWDTSPVPRPPLQSSLLFRFSKAESIEDLVNSLPPKSATDQLVNLFASGLDIPPLPIHLPMFFRDYQVFWDNPGEVTLPWLSILFSVIALALQFVLSSGIKMEGIPFVEAACRKYVAKAAECLTRSDYAKPTSKTVEAMLVYLISEHIYLGDDHFQASLILGSAIRLAIRSGYHRDPSHYRKMSLFDGEMRRRTWSLLVQLDYIFASILGLPRHISHHLSDTALPSCIADADLHEELTTLPPTCDMEEPSSIVFLNERANLTKLLGQVTDCTTSFSELSGEEVCALDQAIDLQAETRPKWLKYPGVIGRTMDETMHLNWALEIDIFEQRTRIILHRNFLALAYADPEYIPSRNKCLEAATRVLQHQQIMASLSFNADRMVVQNWRVLSIMSQDFLLSAMVICLDFDQDLRHGPLPGSSPIAMRGGEEVEERLALLKSYQDFLRDADKPIPGAVKAGRAIELVVSQVESTRESYVGCEGVIVAASDPHSNSHDVTASLAPTSEFLQTMVQGLSSGLDWNMWDFDNFGAL